MSPQKYFEGNFISPDSFKDMALHKSLFVPDYLTENYEEDFLNDLGMIKAESLGARFGEKRPISEVFLILKEFIPTILINYLARFSNYLAWNGPRALNEDLLQKELYEQAVKEANFRGYSQKAEYEINFSRSSFGSPEIITSILTILLEHGDFGKTNGLDINEKKNSGKLGFVILILNDYFQEIGGSISTEGPKIHLKMLRHLFVQAPLWGILQTFGFRIYRFHKINKGVLDCLSDKNKIYIESIFKKCRGVSFETLNLLIFPLTALWAAEKNFKIQPSLDLASIQKSVFKDELKLFLDSVSLSPSEFQLKI